MRGQGKNPPPSRRKRKAPLSKRGAPSHLSRFSATPTPPAQVSTYAPTYTSSPILLFALSLLSATAGMCAPESAWGAVADPGRPGRAVAGPVGRTAPPQIGRGRRGCGRGGHHPPLRPGAAGVSPSRPARPPGLPDPAGIRRFRKGVHRHVLPSNSPSGEASFPWGRARGQALPPVGAEAP
jgi:hypothetical protein